MGASVLWAFGKMCLCSTLRADILVVPVPFVLLPLSPPIFPVAEKKTSPPSLEAIVLLLLLVVPTILVLLIPLLLLLVLLLLLLKRPGVVRAADALE